MSDEIPLTRECTIDAGYAGRASFALLKRYFLRRPSTWLGLVLIVVAVVLAVLGVEAMWYLAAFLVVFTLLFPTLLFFATRRAFRRQLPEGTILRTGFGDTRFLADGPGFTSAVEYSYYSTAERQGEFVALRPRRSRSWTLFPGSLFDDADLARFGTS